MEQWEKFLAPYKQAVEELKIKLKGMRQDYQLTRQSSPVEFVTARVKPVQSIIEKASARNIPYDRLQEGMYDIAGVRIMCQFVDDIETDIVPGTVIFSARITQACDHKKTFHGLYSPALPRLLPGRLSAVLFGMYSLLLY